MAAQSLPHYKALSPLEPCGMCDNMPSNVSLTKLEPTAYSGCHRCGLLFWSAKKALGNDLARFSINGFMPRNGQISVYEKKAELRDVIVITSDSESRPLDKIPAVSVPGFEIFTLAGSQTCSVPWVDVRRPTPARVLHECLPTLSSWIEDCIHHHNCAPSDGPLPSRILDFGEIPSDQIRLRSTNRESARYIAFSHCWGTTGHMQVRTTRANFSDRLQGFKVDDLPKSYREVISIANALDVRYVWIDSFCIIQDDKDDWEAQSGDMAAIYNNAFLVVGASCAQDSSEGFIASPSYKPSTRIATVENMDGTISDIYTRRIEQHGHLCSPFAYNTTNGPLASRGWTLQEQILSRRMVHFEQFEMIWECRNAMKCECEELDSYRAKDYKTVMESEFMSSKQSSKTWYSIVNEYHTRSLTHASDFLPALSGIVTHLQNFGAGEYLTGLWATKLHEQLLWHATTSPPSRLCVRAQPYRAPTWSWASLDRPSKRKDGSKIQFFNSYHDSPLVASCHILRASCTRAGRDKNGAILAGELNIEGRLIRIVYNQDRWDERRAIPLQEISPTPMLEESRTPLYVAFDTGEYYSNTDLYALVIGYEKYRKRKHDGLRFHGLVLRALDQGNNTFERAGYWTMGVHMIAKDGIARKARRRNVEAVEREHDLAPKSTITIV
ncbi:heterokaryon incompatibility protein-domain-containing protein [Phaeosphaeria sp. MPI-PUGE-AT-0046c]|nr:heterokaryon incompatibility protein-domain-containing protein [Phaeosphaeria sp. MPI-PUGE-AT-0046c]